MEPEKRFVHDCSTCVFKGQGFFDGQPVDWYTCTSPNGLRTVIARFGNEGPQYACARVGETVEPTRVVMAALAQGLDLEQDERNLLLKQLLARFRQSMGPDFWRACMPAECDETPTLGDADWLSVREKS